MILETKEQLIERLIKAGHITFSEALKLCEKEPTFVFPPYNPPPYNPNIQPYYYEWYPGPVMTYCSNSKVSN